MSPVPLGSNEAAPRGLEFDVTGANTVTVPDTSQRLSSEQQAQWVAKLQAAEFREPDIPSDLLGAGLWIAYAVLALVWFRSVPQRRILRWLASVREGVAVPMVASQTVRGLQSVKGERPPAPIFPEPADARI
jgi:hypothetical protein